MDPWFNREFKSERVWRYYALCTPESQDMGYINIFFDDPHRRQDNSAIGMKDGVLIASHYNLYHHHGGIVGSPKWIVVKSYDEWKRYQVLLKVGFDKSRTTTPKSGLHEIDNGAYFAVAWDHIKLLGFLI